MLPSSKHLNTIMAFRETVINQTIQENYLESDIELRFYLGDLNLISRTCIGWGLLHIIHTKVCDYHGICIEVGQLLRSYPTSPSLPSRVGTSSV
jgi:hypothetical protein